MIWTNQLHPETEGRTVAVVAATSYDIVVLPEDASSSSVALLLKNEEDVQEKKGMNLKEDSLKKQDDSC